jgi:hypothetical protein
MRQFRKAFQEKKASMPSRALAFLQGVFWRDEPAAEEGERSSNNLLSRHTRSKKERRMRRARHHDTMRSIAR